MRSTTTWSHRAGLGLLFALAGSAPAAAQVSIGPQTQVDLGRGPEPCNETSMAASPANPLEIVGGWNDYRESGTVRTGVCLSLDGGQSWSDQLVRPGPQNQTTVEGDPMTAADPRTGTLWVGAIAFGGNGGVFVARKDPGDTGFQPTVMADVTGSADKGWMAAGPRPGEPDSTRVYVAYNLGLIWSDDLGDTWTDPVALPGGVGYLPRVGPNGELYIAYWDFGDGVMMVRSFDGGQTISSPIRIATRMDVWPTQSTDRIPGNFRVPSLNYIAVDPNDGALYCTYFDTTDVVGGNANVDIWFCKSVDQGGSWSTPVVINGDSSPPGDQFFSFIEVDESSRLQLLTYDSRGIDQDDTDSPALFHAYYSYSDDGGASWTEHPLTPQAIDSGLAFSNDGFIGDYSGLATAGGRTWPLYMATPNGDAGAFTHVIERESIESYCYGVGCPCGNDDPSAGCGNAGADADPATGAVMVASGSNAIAADDLVLTVTGVQPNQFGIVYTGQGRANDPFGDGLRCVLGPFFRYAPKQADGAGALVYGPSEVVSYSIASFGPAGQLLPGATWNYQAWYRDPAGPCGSGFNLSNGVEVTWQ